MCLGVGFKGRHHVSLVFWGEVAGGLYKLPGGLWQGNLSLSLVAEFIVAFNIHSESFSTACGTPPRALATYLILLLSEQILTRFSYRKVMN